MSGTNFNRERREVLPGPNAQAQAPALPEVSARSAMWATREANEGIPMVMDQVARITRREAGEMSVELARESAAAEPIERDAEGRIVVPDMSRGFLPTAASEARREVLQSRYVSELVNQEQETVARLRRESGENPDAFRAAFEAHRNGLVQRLPEGIRTVFGQRLMELGNQHYQSLMAQQIQRERDQAATEATILITRRAQDAYDLRVQGQDSSAAQGEALAALRANRNILSGQQYALLERQITVVSPVQAELFRAVRSNPAGQGQLVVALQGGPGTPGWREEWGQLTQDERRQLAQLTSSMIGAARSDISWGQQQADRAERNNFARINLDLAQTRAAIAALPADAPASERQRLLTQMATLTEQSIQLTPRYAAQAVLQTAQAQAGARQQEAENAVAGLRTNQALNTLGAGSPDEWRPADPRVTAIMGLPQSVSPATRAALLEEVVREQATESRRDREQREREIRFLGALGAAANPGAAAGSFTVQQQLPQNEDFTRMWLDRLQSSGFRDFRQVPTEVHVLGARAGIVPDQIPRLMQEALQSGDQAAYRRMASVHEAMAADPMALPAYRRAVGERLFAAYSGAADFLRTQPPPSGDGPETNPVIARSIEWAQRVSRGDPNLEAEVRPLLGATRDAQDTAINNARIAAMEAAGVSSMPAQARETFNGLFMLHYAQNRDAGQSARLAMADLRTNWTPSRLGIEGLAPDRVGLVGRATGSGPDQRLVREPPERFAVPEGRAGVPSTDWIQRHAREVMTGMGIPRDVVEGAEFGRNAFLRVSPDRRSPTGAPLYEVWVTRRGPSGEQVLTDIPAVVEGRATGGSLLLDLETAARERTDRWRTRYLEGNERRREEQRIRDEADIPLGRAPMGTGVQGQ